jgi:hypothetical protein
MGKFGILHLAVGMWPLGVREDSPKARLNAMCQMLAAEFRSYRRKKKRVNRGQGVVYTDGKMLPPPVLNS